ncbi:hypothetical protein [Terricaulis sp.]|uniref:hypothetical protein n=1 Tax=Terricaulis sp. TaxID=2768686 RepID=UPI002AC44A3D|nr:hypothetical protein [Terricaulis sp.]MDZ4691522.1 hypothetical protein [Terricaulis sp.]
MGVENLPAMVGCIDASKHAPERVGVFGRMGRVQADGRISWLAPGALVGDEAPERDALAEASLRDAVAFFADARLPRRARINPADCVVPLAAWKAQKARGAPTRMGATDIAILIVTDDRAHAEHVRESLGDRRFRYAVTEVSETIVNGRFEVAVEAARGKLPLIVFIDCRFLKDQAHVFAARIRALEASMAIACVATHPPLDRGQRALLARFGASLFDAAALTD